MNIRPPEASEAFFAQEKLQTTIRPKFSVTSEGVILNQRGLNPHPPPAANRKLITTSKVNVSGIVTFCPLYAASVRRW